jgi:predicted nucleic acid-binding protein
MRISSCTIDTSCIIALDHLDLLPSLSLLFSKVLVPKAVREDLYKRRGTKKRIQSLFDEYAFLEPCNDYDKAAVEILLVERMRKGAKDRGEVEAVVQASQLGAMVVVDDPLGRELAGRLSLDCHGTVWVLKTFYELGLISASTLRSNFSALSTRESGFPGTSLMNY